METRSKIRQSAEKFGRSALRFLKRQQTALPSRAASTPGMLVITAILSLIAGYQQFSPDIRIENGVVQVELAAQRDFTVVDEEATERRREQAASVVPPVFEYDPKTGMQLVSYLSSELAQMEEQFSQGLRERFGRIELTSSQLESSEYDLFLKQFVRPRNDALSRDDQAIILLAARRFNPELRQDLVAAFGKAMSGYIYPAYDTEEASAQRITVRNIDTGEQGEMRSQELIGLLEAQNRLQNEVGAIRNLSSEERQHFTAMLKPLLVSNLRYSESITNAARAVAKDKVSPVDVTFRENQIIARRGDPATPRVINIIKHLETIEGRGGRAFKLLGLFMILFALVFALRKFSERKTLRHSFGAERAFALISFTLLLQAALVKMGSEVGQQVAKTFGANDSGIHYEFLIPYAGAALIMALLLDAVSAQLCALIVALFVGIVSNGHLGLMLYAFLSGTAATYAVKRYQHRNSITRAAIIIGVINALAVITVLLISNRPATLSTYAYNILYGGIGGGVLTAAFVSVVIPINESLFDILTDVKLLELSNMDLPLLRDLGMYAPGTQQHSMMVGSLSEEASEAIGANSLLVRIGCYYHDVGKIMAPEMFIENQGGRENPHDKMDPKRSASVIIGHVKKGILMGQEAGLPVQITDLIPQHHGTRRLHYFYNKALDQVSKTGEPVNEEHYRYPGPKPQTREAAIIMLADGAEAAARSLDDPSPENIREIVKRILEDVIADGQLEECELTMREFNTLRETLIETLCNIYHHRIKYPGFNLHTMEETEGGPPPEEKKPALKEDPKETSPKKMVTAAGKNLAKNAKGAKK